MLSRCQAIEFPGRMICPRCSLSWPGNQFTSKRPECRSQPMPPVSLGEVIEQLRSAAEVLIGSQVALVKAEMREEPYRPQLRHAAVLLAAADLIECIRADQQIMQRLRKRREQPQ